MSIFFFLGENVVVLEFLAVDNFDFTRKIVRENLGGKLVRMLGFFKIELLDKISTFRIVRGDPTHLDRMILLKLEKQNRQIEGR